MKRYWEYLVEYHFDSGSGRSFSVVGEPLTSMDAVLRLEQRLKNDVPHLRNLNIRHFVLLRTGNTLDHDAPVKELE
jgi:hypothetical protein